MDKEKLLLELIEMLLGTETKEITATMEATGKKLIGEYVIVRCRDAGVHSGILVDYENRNVELKESRRLWYFKCKKGNSLSGVALHGITGDSKIAGELPSVLLRDACEIILTSDKSERSIRDAKEYNS